MKITKDPRLNLDAKSFQSLRRSVLKRDGWRCQSCDSLAGLEVHHITPRSEAGTRSRRKSHHALLGVPPPDSFDEFDVEATAHSSCQTLMLPAQSSRSLVQSHHATGHEICKGIYGSTLGRVVRSMVKDTVERHTQCRSRSPVSSRALRKHRSPAGTHARVPEGLPRPFRGVLTFYTVALGAFFLRAKNSPERPTPSRDSEQGSGTAVKAENVEVPDSEVNTKLPSVVAKQA